MRGVSPTEGDVVLRKSDESVVRDGDAVSVGTEIAQRVFGSTEGRLGVDDPVVAEQYSQPCAESAWLGKRQQAAMELEFTAMEGVAEFSDELAAEDTAEHLDWKKERAA